MAAMLALSDADALLPDLAGAMDDDPAARASLASLQAAGAALGLSLDGVAGDLNALAPRTPFIAQVVANGIEHFVLVEQVGADWVRLVDGGVVQVARRSYFESVFSGFALVKGERLRSPAPAALRFDCELFDLGRLTTDEPQQVTFGFVNRGERPVRVWDLQAPGDSRIVVPTDTIGPGERGEISIAFTPTRRPADGELPLWAHFLIGSDDPQRLRIILSARATIAAASAASGR